MKSESSESMSMVMMMFIGHKFEIEPKKVYAHSKATQGHSHKAAPVFALHVYKAKLKHELGASFSVVATISFLAFSSLLPSTTTSTQKQSTQHPPLVNTPSYKK